MEKKSALNSRRQSKGISNERSSPMKTKKSMHFYLWKNYPGFPSKLPLKKLIAGIIILLFCILKSNTFFYRSRLYIYGGFDTHSGILCDFKVFSDLNHESQWISLTTKNGPGPRHSHSSFMYQGQIYIFGGKVDIFNNTNSLFCYSIEKQEWKEIQQNNTSEGPKPIDSHKCVIIQDEMVVVGGFSQNQETMNIHTFNMKTHSWKTLYQEGQDKCQPIPRSDFSLIERNRKLYIFAGKSGDKILSDFWEFELGTCKFKQIKNQNQELNQRSGHNAVVYQNTMLIFGGITGVTHERNDLLSYNFETGFWSVIWKNYQDQNEKKISNTLKIKSKKNSINKPREVQKCKILFHDENLRTTQIKKYRRPLREEMLERKVQEKRTQNSRMRKINGKKIQLLNEFQGSTCDIKNTLCTHSPIVETLSHSIHLTANNSSVMKILQDTPTFQEKILKPRDGHTMHLMKEEEKMIIFGGDRHTIGFNDIVIVDLKQLMIDC